MHVVEGLEDGPALVKYDGSPLDSRWVYYYLTLIKF